jgi:hypothetical protein
MEFVGKISGQGDGLIIWIPKEFHKQAEKIKGKFLKVQVEEVL